MIPEPPELTHGTAASPSPTLPSTNPKTPKQRLARYKRAEHPPAMVLTKRDMEILRQVYAYRLLTRKQIQHLLFSPTTTSICRKRLKLLFQHAYVDRIHLVIRADSPANEPIYRLAKNGAALIAQELDMPVSRLTYWGKGDDKDQRRSMPSVLFLEHTLEENDLRIAFMLATKKHGYQVTTWLDDATLKNKPDRVAVTFPNGKTFRKTIIPDGYCVLDVGTHFAHFFLEIDRGTMNLTERWRGKLLTYAAYFASPEYEQRYKVKTARVLTITTSPERALHLKRLAEELGMGKRFWFTSRADVAAEKLLSAPIWLISGEQDKKPLIQLPGKS